MIDDFGDTGRTLSTGFYSLYGKVALSILVLTMIWVSYICWNKYENHKLEKALGYFEILENAMEYGTFDSSLRVRAVMKILQKKYPRTDYAEQGALVSAYFFQKQNDVSVTKNHLEWILRECPDSILQPVVRLHLAGVMLDRGDYNEALVQLKNTPPGFIILFADRRADVLKAQGKQEQAWITWQVITKLLPVHTPLAQIIRLKLDSLVRS